LLPVNDWKEVKDIHFQMAPFRAIENGMPLVRTASSGLSSAFTLRNRPPAAPVVGQFDCRLA
jgi:hypothetical protein